VNKDKQFVELL